MQCIFISEGRQWPWLEDDISFIMYVLCLMVQKTTYSNIPRCSLRYTSANYYVRYVHF